MNNKIKTMMTAVVLGSVLCQPALADQLLANKQGGAKTRLQDQQLKRHKVFKKKPVAFNCSMLQLDNSRMA